MKRPFRHEYVATLTVALPGFGVAYLADARLAGQRAPRRHSHAEVQLLWVRSGNLNVAFDDDEGDPMNVNVGQVVIAPAGLGHVVDARMGGFARSGDAHLIDLRLIDHPTNPLRQFIDTLGTHRRLPTDPTAVERAAGQFETINTMRGPARHASLMAVVWELLASIRPPLQPLARNDSIGAPATTDPRIIAAEKFCRNQLSTPLSIDTIAAAVGLSRSQLTRLFMATYGIGPAERVRQLRIELGRRLLVETTLSVKEIAHACGFLQANHFGRVFQRETGLLASDFRAGKTQE